MSGKSSRNKGLAFERRMARVFSSWSGLKVVRTPLSGAMSEITKSDLFCKDTFPFFIECKKRKSIKLTSLLTRTGDIVGWWVKTYSNALKESKYPILIFSENNGVEMVLVPVIGECWFEENEKFYKWLVFSNTYYKCYCTTLKIFLDSVTYQELSESVADWVLKVKGGAKNDSL